jgi:hypothetical protein
LWLIEIVRYSRFHHAVNFGEHAAVIDIRMRLTAKGAGPKSSIDEVVDALFTSAS